MLISTLGRAVAPAVCVAVLTCGSSEPGSALILGREEAKNAVPGVWALSQSQSRRLQHVITSSGQPCAAIERAYLRDVAYAHDDDQLAAAESWEVRCTDAPYAVTLRADGSPGEVRRCFGTSFDAPCRRDYTGRQRNREPGGPLNPELGKLLEPMTAKDGRAD